jgi:hypothetical protein
MATVKPGIVGNFNGKIGEVVLSRWKDTNVGKSTPRKSTKPPKLAQLDQRARFGLVNKFFGSISKVVSAGYQREKSNRTKMNIAVSYHLEKAVTGTYPNYVLDYSKILISDPDPKNSIDDGIATEVVPGEKNTFKISWFAADMGFGNSKPTDNAYFLFYSPVQEKFILFPGPAIRSSLTHTVRLPRIFEGEKLHGYMFFFSEDGKAVSFTDYLGQYTLLA